MNQVNEVLAFANKYIGYLEKASNSQLESMTANAGDKNYTIFAEWYKTLTSENYQAQPWCAMFISTCFTKALGDTEGKKLCKPFAYCPTGVNWFKAQGRWHTANPQAGDIVFFADSTGLACHVGIVSSVGTSTVVTIEGNTSGGSTVIANGGGVCKKSYNRSYARILGYGRPDYAKHKEEENKVVKKKTIVIDGVAHNCDVIEKDGNNYVRLRSFTEAGYGIGYNDTTNLASITAPMRRAVVPEADAETEQALGKLQAVCGLQDATLVYLMQYAWGDDLVKKLAAGIKDN